MVTLDRVANANLERIVRRWPSLAVRLAASAPAEAIWAHNGGRAPSLRDKLLWSAWDPDGEARQQAAAIPPEARSAIVYGFGSGLIPPRLLERETLRALLVVPLSLPVMRLSLALGPLGWLEDERVQLLYGADLGGPWGPTVPFTVAAGELPHPDAGCERLRDEVAILLSRRFQTLQMKGAVGREVEQTEANLALGDPPVAKMDCVSEWFDGRFIVCAAGPSLAGQLPWLHQRQEDAIVVAVASALRPLLAAGIVPDVCVAMDGAPEGALYLQGVDREETRTIALVYDPVVIPEVVQAWLGPRFFAHCHPAGDLWSDGTVTHAACDLAVRLGAKEVQILGADFCYAHDRTHVDGAGEATDATGLGPIETQNGHGQPARTTLTFNHMRRRLERYIEQRPGVQWRKRGRAGVPLEGAPWSD